MIAGGARPAPPAEGQRDRRAISQPAAPVDIDRHAEEERVCRAEPQPSPARERHPRRRAGRHISGHGYPPTITSSQRRRAATTGRRRRRLPTTTRTARTRPGCRPASNGSDTSAFDEERRIRDRQQRGAHSRRSRRAVGEIINSINRTATPARTCRRPQRCAARRARCSTLKNAKGSVRHQRPAAFRTKMTTMRPR